ncbi:MAG: enoyl-CoA hydratase/isomerase family protein [Flavobacteriaceae bacterium]
MDGTLTLDIHQQIATLTFGHPAANSLRPEMLSDLCDLIREADTDPQVKVLIIQSEGERAFCAGASLEALKKVTTEEQGTEFFMGFARLMNSIRNCSKFVIARVQGKVVGGGIGLVAACDYAIARDTASIRLSELSIGIGPYVIEPAVSRKMGKTAFNQLSLDSANWRSAEWAYSKGLYAGCCASLEQLDQEVKSLTERLAGYDLSALQKLNELHWNDTEHWDELLPKKAKITGQLALSEHCQNILHQKHG